MWIVICWKEYCRTSSITAFKRKCKNESGKSSPLKSRVHTTFDFKRMFYLWIRGWRRKRKKSKNAHDLISCFSTINFKDKILDLPDKKGDNVLKTVKKRISFEIDLDKIKHNPGTGEKKGRAQNNNINTAMENVSSYIENYEDCQFTLS